MNWGGLEQLLYEIPVPVDKHKNSALCLSISAETV